jgi:hypothetical protein
VSTAVQHADAAMTSSQLRQGSCELPTDPDPNYVTPIVDDAPPLPTDDYRRLVTRLRAEQGLPPTVEDEATIDRLAALLTP